MHHRTSLVLLTSISWLAAMGCSSGDGASGTVAKLAPECIEDATDLEGWLCPEDLTVQCEDGGADPELIYFEPTGDLPESCDEISLSLNDEGPFDLGTHDIVVTASAGDGNGEPTEVTCEATLTVEDTEAPEAKNGVVELWPPNHKFHTITGEDCVRDACDRHLEVAFLSASSDEPVNARGDGNTEPDILLACDQVQLRSERQGGSNGRVYTLAWTAVDDAGNRTDGECIVAVPHDQSGRKAIDDGPAYEITLDEDECDLGGGGMGGSGGAGGAAGMGGSGGAGGAAGMDGAAGMGGAGGMGGMGGIVVP